MKKTWDDQKFINAVQTSKTYIEVMIKLGMSARGPNYKTIYKHVKRLNIDISHFLTREEILAQSRSKIAKLTNQELFCENNISRSNIKKRILQQNLIEYKCNKCGITEWCGEKLSLHLDHKNGNNKDNRLENLQFLCPNCHSLTDSYCGKNVKNINYPEHNLQKYCECGTPITYKSTFCKLCFAKKNPACQTKINWTSPEYIIDILKRLGSFVQAAKYLGVSDSAVRNYLKRNNINPKTIFVDVGPQGIEP